jgi:glycyl-tRNA synthetase
MKGFVESLGIPSSSIREYEHPAEARSHYSKKTVDLEFAFPFGQKELTGLAYRTDYDLGVHQKMSGQTLEYFDQETGERLVPHVIEPSFGLDRLVLAVLTSAYAEDSVEGEDRVVLRFAPSVAPIKVAVLPLMKKDGLGEKGREVWEMLSKECMATYDETGSIGKRYRRQDEVGTPWCVTVDYETLENGTVTVRDRDTLEQDRLPFIELPEYFREKLS